MRDNSLTAWEANAVFWDRFMGDESNDFHRRLVRPGTVELLDPKAGEFVLDIACGNGNFSEWLADRGVRVKAFDYSSKMIELARKRRRRVLDRVQFTVCDATDRNELLGLREDRPFDKAVSNMALMDIADIHPLLHTVFEMLKPGGVFVFSAHHPCFTYPNRDYMTVCDHLGEAIVGQPVLQTYYHRPLTALFEQAFQAGFVMDGFREVCFEKDETPIIMIVRLRKM